MEPKEPQKKEAARIALMHARITFAAHPTPKNEKALQNAQRVYDRIVFDEQLEAGRTVLK